ncbi:MAG: GTP-binding protein, partial [Bacteroidetes bacterium]|nr:GTP-binding protein [Bacteroidota bacterium]
LAQLQSLDLRNNQISDIRPLIPLIKNGRTVKFDYSTDGINLRDNPLTNPPLEIAKQGNEAILTYFASLKKGKTITLKEIKILLIGEGMAGKTSLLKQIKGLPFSKHESQTHGINIEPLILGEQTPFQSYHEVADVKGRFWDFGGQEIMHASHQFFMTRRAVYILLLDSRTDAKKEYWLQHIHTYGGDNSPLFVVINKIDENKSYSIEQRTLNQKYPLIENRFYRISCKNGEGLEQLFKDIAEVIPETELFGTKVREEWVFIKDQLEAATEEDNYLDETRFRTICVENKVTDKIEQETLLNFLHELGIVLHFKNLELQNFYVLDPHWLTVGVYKIINSHEVPDGILKEGQLDFILNEEETKKEEYDPAGEREFTYNAQEQLYLVKVMEEFELLYKFADQTYLVPDLLPKEPKEEVSLNETDEAHIHFILEYDFLPNSIISRFI